MERQSKMQVKNPFIALLTDFGLEDHYVAAIKGVIYSINPEARITDICHTLRPQNILQGAFILKESYRYFPKGTIFVAVVDPGVGTRRNALCVKTENAYFIGPDNGLLGLALREEKSFLARKITNSQFFRKPVSSTFHGRDIFSPVAAHLSRRDIFRLVGPQVSKIQLFDISQAKESARAICGSIVHIDRFGNAITNISRKKVPKVTRSVKIKSLRLKKIHDCFAEGGEGQLIAVWNSSDLLEFAVPNGNAEKKFALKLGDRAEIIYE